MLLQLNNSHIFTFWFFSFFCFLFFFLLVLRLYLNENRIFILFERIEKEKTEVEIIFFFCPSTSISTFSYSIFVFLLLATIFTIHDQTNESPVFFFFVQLENVEMIFLVSFLIFVHFVVVVVLTELFFPSILISFSFFFPMLSQSLYRIYRVSCVCLSF